MERRISVVSKEMEAENKEGLISSMILQTLVTRMHVHTHTHVIIYKGLELHIYETPSEVVHFNISSFNSQEHTSAYQSI